MGEDLFDVAESGSAASSESGNIAVAMPDDKDRPTVAQDW